MAGQGTGHITRALAANAAIAAAKGAAAAATGSGALLAETFHSASDCANQALLLLGLRRARRPASETHPLGYGRALYFWSFLVALLLFSAGGLFAIYEGVHKLMHPEPIARAWIGLLILSFSIAVEGWAMAQAVAEIHRRRGALPFWTYLRGSKDSDLIVVFGEDLGALLGLIAAIAALVLAEATGNPVWDAAGTLAVGVILVAVAAFLAVEVKSLLIGEAADPAISAAIHRAAAADPRLGRAHSVVTLQQGPGEVLVALKVDCARDLAAGQLGEAINAFERRLRGEHPECRWVFVEPDLSGAPLGAPLPTGR